MQKLLTLSQAARKCPGRPHISTIWRWCRKGLKAATGETVRLPHVRVGAKICIRPDDLENFFQRLAEADLPKWEPRSDVPLPQRSYQSQHASAMSFLEKRGVVTTTVSEG